jgi:hypothetical protein
MRTNCIVFAMMLLLCGPAWAQQQEKGFYLRAVGGLSMGAAKTEHPGIDAYTLVNPQTGAIAELSEKGLYGSYGGGAKGGLAFGYSMNQILAFEMGLNYFQSWDQLRERNVYAGIGMPERFQLEQTAYARALALIPSLVLSAGNTTGLNPYTRVSLVVPVWGDLVISTQIDDPVGFIDGSLSELNVRYDREDRVDPVKPQLGFEAAIGVAYPLNHKISVFVEAEFRALTVDGHSRKTTRFDVKAGNETIRSLKDFPVGITQANYKEKLTLQDNVRFFHHGELNPGFDPSKPADELKPFANINGLGFNAGLRLAL